MSKLALLAAIDLLEITLSHSADLVRIDLDDHRREVIQQRRLIAAQRLEISRVGEEAFDDPIEREKFRREFSKMRSAAALHQASWPVVSIDVENAAYLTSVRATRDANREFIAWIREVLAGDRPHIP